MKTSFQHFVIFEASQEFNSDVRLSKETLKLFLNYYVKSMW